VLSNRQKKTFFFPRDLQKGAAQKQLPPKNDDERPTPEAQVRA
jgi:hypothetical protein